MALNTVVGGPAADSFASISEADRYFASHYSTAKTVLWATLSGPRKESVLRRACQYLETLKVLDNEYTTGSLPAALVVDFGYDLTIHKALVNQRLQFPRNLDVSGTTENAVYIPQEVKDAQCEQAVYLLAFDDSAFTIQSQGIVAESVTAGPVKVYTKYAGDAGSKGGSFTPTYLSPMVVELMRPFLRMSSRLRRA